MAQAALVRAPSPAARRGLCIATLLLALASSGCLPPARGPLTVWAVDERDVLAADTPPTLESELFSATRGRIELLAAINETVAFQLGLHTSGAAIGPLAVEISDLTGPGGTLPAGSTTSLFRVQPIHVEHFHSWYPQHVGGSATPMSVPDILVPWNAPQGGGPVMLNSKGHEVVWVDLRVPPTATPGLYTGKLVVNNVAKTKVEFSCDLRLRVLPVAMPSVRSLPVICRIDPRDLLSSHLQWPRERPEQTRLLRDSPSQGAAIALIDATMRLFQEHRTNPVLWASFPKYVPVSENRMKIEWEPYDRLVERWLSGEAFSDLVALTHWPVPVSLEYPNAAREGGLGSPTYSRLLATYLAECQRHFAERGWQNAAFVRLCEPEELTPDAIECVERVSRIIQDAGVNLPLVAHLPASSLRGFGWRDAPLIDLPQVDIWAPPAAWYEPEAMRGAQALGRSAWLMPDHPPYSGSLAPASLSTDAPALGWQAYRYEIDALWIEHAAEFSEQYAAGGQQEWLIYPGSRYGLPDRPVPSVRLKRLRRGLQDHSLLSLLSRRGKRVLADELSKQIVRWAGTDACLDHLLSCKPTGWPRDARLMGLAREVMLLELAGDSAGASDAGPTRAASMSEWGRVMNAARRVFVSVEGVRLRSVGDELHANILCAALNLTNTDLSGRWVLPAPPEGWSQLGEPTTTVPPDTRRRTPLEVSLAGAAYNTDGAYPFNVRFDTDALGSFAVAARLAVASCPPLERAPTIDGDLSDWPLASSNAAGDFQLVRGERPGFSPGEANRPALPTQAFFAADRENLYVGVRCRLGKGQPPIWQTDNRVPVDGAIPWGQDVVEIIIDPRGAPEGRPDDLYMLQIKPTSVVVARKGCPTDPPIGESTLWHSQATVAVSVQPDAWVIEVAVPLTSLGPAALENNIWGFNVTRLDARRGEYSSWSGATDTCYSPQSLGNLLLLGR